MISPRHISLASVRVLNSKRKRSSDALSRSAPAPRLCESINRTFALRKKVRSAHVDAVHSKVARKIGALRRSSRQLTRQARRSFFLTVIQPDLEYSAVACIPNMPEIQKQRLLTLWRKAVRCVAGAERHADVDPICNIRSYH